MEHAEEDRFSELRAALGSFDGDGRRRQLEWVARRAGTIAVGVVAVAAVVLGVSWLRPVGSAGSSPSARPSTGAPREAPTTATTPVAAAAAGAARVWPSEPVEVAGTEVRTRGHRWSVGEAGDLVAVGDWDCDGTPTPAVLRPAAGQVFVFDRWADGTGEVAATPGPSAPGDAVSFAANGCGSALVGSAGGEVVTLELAGER